MPTAFNSFVRAFLPGKQRIVHACMRSCMMLEETARPDAGDQLTNDPMQFVSACLRDEFGLPFFLFV